MRCRHERDSRYHGHFRRRGCEGPSSDTTAPGWPAMAAGVREGPTRKAAARECHQARDRSGDSPPPPPNPQLLTRRRDGAAASTIEALAYSLRRGVDTLTEPDAARRLAELSDDQLLEVGERLRRFKPEVAQAWSADDVAVLMQVRERLKCPATT